MPKLKSSNSDNNNQKKNRLAKELLEDYSDRTTIHGIHYIGDRNQTNFERLLWLIIILVSLMASIFFILNLVDKLNDKPVMVTFADKSWSTIRV